MLENHTIMSEGILTEVVSQPGMRSSNEEQSRCPRTATAGTLLAQTVPGKASRTKKGQEAMEGRQRMDERRGPRDKIGARPRYLKHFKVAQAELESEPKHTISMPDAGQRNDPDSQPDAPVVVVVRGFDLSACK